MFIFRKKVFTISNSLTHAQIGDFKASPNVPIKCQLKSFSSSNFFVNHLLTWTVRTDIFDLLEHLFHRKKRTFLLLLLHLSKDLLSSLCGLRLEKAKGPLRQWHFHRLLSFDFFSLSFSHSPLFSKMSVQDFRAVIFTPPTCTIVFKATSQLVNMFNVCSAWS